MLLTMVTVCCTHGYSVLALSYRGYRLIIHFSYSESLIVVIVYRHLRVAAWWKKVLWIFQFSVRGRNLVVGAKVLPPLSHLPLVYLSLFLPISASSHSRASPRQ
jgi:hypothetical protein